MAGELKHTHYSPYGPPRQVPGTLLECNDTGAHDITMSEVFADYMYSPEFGLESATGLGLEHVTELVSAYLATREEGTQFRIMDVVADEEYTYRVRITNSTRNAAGPAWHTQFWGLHPDGKWHRVLKNPHPGYEHWPAFCPNCGY